MRVGFAYAEETKLCPPFGSYDGSLGSGSVTSVEAAGSSPVRMSQFLRAALSTRCKTSDSVGTFECVAAIALRCVVAVV